MNVKTLVLLLLLPLLTTGCGSKDNFVILSPSGDGRLGALEIQNDGGSAVLDEEGKAVYIDDRESAPSEPTPVDPAETKEIFHDALAVRPMPPQSFILYFNKDSEELTEESQKVVPAILEAVRTRQSSDISIIGHTDRLGEEGYNRILSMERAQVVYDILRARNIAGEQMTILYYGEGNPVVPTADNVAEPRNRRVEVMVR